MIQPNEVRIGNLVEYQGRVFEIATISEEFPTLNTDEFGIGVVDWNNINPVEITEELLINFGFSDKDYQNGYIGIEVAHTDFVLCKPDKNGNIHEQKYNFKMEYGGWPRIKPFDSIHELQNFFFFHFMVMN